MSWLDGLADVVEAWRGDAALFVSDQFGIEPTEQQKLLLRAASKPGAHVAVKSGHGTGKSTAMAWLILWALCCWEDVKIPCTAPTAHQLEDILWPEVEKWRPRMLEPWRSSVTVTKDTVKMTGLPGFAVARTGRKENPEALQGFHAENLLFLVDEASGIPDQVFEVARGALSTPDARVIMAANPTRTTGFFHNAFHRNRDSWERFTFSCADSPLVAPEYLAEMEEEYGKDSDIYRVRVLGEFPKGGDLQFIPSSLVVQAQERYYREETFSFAPVCLGVDVAAFGGDRCVIFLRQGLYSELLWTGREVETATLAGMVAKYEDEKKADAVFVDATGVGFGVASNLRQMGRTPFAVELGGASARQEYLNKRAECWGLMRDWLKEGGWIPKDENLRDDLCAPEYGYTTTGKVQLERKEKMRARGLASPDLADALALTFAFPVVPKGQDVPDFQPRDRMELFEWGRR